MFDSLGAEVFARNPASLYLWVAVAGVEDSLALAENLLEQGIVMAPGRIFSVDPSNVSRWTRVNVGAVADPRFADALRGTLPRMRD